jgi:hypothetical protein
MELYDRLRRDDPAQAARMAFITGGAFTDAAAAFIAKMGERCLHKPLSAAGLRGLVAGLLAASGAA